MSQKGVDLQKTSRDNGGGKPEEKTKLQIDTQSRTWFNQNWRELERENQAHMVLWNSKARLPNLLTWRWVLIGEKGSLGKMMNCEKNTYSLLLWMLCRRQSVFLRRLSEYGINGGMQISPRTSFKSPKWPQTKWYHRNIVFWPSFLRPFMWCDALWCEC